MAHNDPNISQALMTSMDSMNSVVGGLSLQHRLSSIPIFDGANLPLKDFLRDVQNVASFVPENSITEFLCAVIGRLRGDARDCTEGEEITTVAELVKVLKDGLARARGYDFYASELLQLRLNQGETIRHLYNRTRALVSSAKSAWNSDFGFAFPVGPLDTDPLEKTALKAFCRALPTRIGELMVIAKPKKLKDAYEIAAEVLSHSEPPGRMGERTHMRASAEDPLVLFAKGPSKGSRSRSPSPAPPRGKTEARAEEITSPEENPRPSGILKTKSSSTPRAKSPNSRGENSVGCSQRYCCSRRAGCNCCPWKNRSSKSDVESGGCENRYCCSRGTGCSCCPWNQWSHRSDPDSRGQSPRRGTDSTPVDKEQPLNSHGARRVVSTTSPPARSREAREPAVKFLVARE